MEKREAFEDLANELRESLDTKWAGHTAFYYEETDSTNIRARALAKEGCPHGGLVAAERQSCGRGRWGRAWYSPAGGIYISLILRPKFQASKARMLTLIAALSAVEAIKECTGLDVGVKWPNDLVISGKKTAGILTEMSAEEGRINHVVVGFGINANTDGFPKALKNTATSLKKERGAQVKISVLIAAVLKHFERNYDIFAETLSIEKLWDKYDSLLINKGKTVKITGAEGTYEACMIGIDHEGKLLVRKKDGAAEAIYAGEVLV